ncbi:hypothetical protein SK128_028505, partial [Halocaridina rubra]
RKRITLQMAFKDIAGNIIKGLIRHDLKREEEGVHTNVEYAAILRVEPPSTQQVQRVLH